MSTTRLTFTNDQNIGPVAYVNGERLDLGTLELAAAWAAHAKALNDGTYRYERTNDALREVGHLDLLVAARKLAGPANAGRDLTDYAIRLTDHLGAIYGDDLPALLHNGPCRVYALHPEAYQIERGVAA